jgi:hypothetical protein
MVHGIISEMQPTRPLWPKNFKEAFCERYRCSPDMYENQVFWRCLYRHALPVAALIYWFNPEFFKEDFDLIREIDKMNSPEVFRSELNFFYGRNLRDKSWIRRTFYIRLSAKRLLKLKNELFSNSLTGLLVLQ